MRLIVCQHWGSDWCMVIPRLHANAGFWVSMFIFSKIPELIGSVRRTVFCRAVASAVTCQVYSSGVAASCPCHAVDVCTALCCAPCGRCRYRLPRNANVVLCPVRTMQIPSSS